MGFEPGEGNAFNFATGTKQNIPRFAPVDNLNNLSALAIELRARYRSTVGNNLIG